MFSLSALSFPQSLPLVHPFCSALMSWTVKWAEAHSGLDNPTTRPLDDRVEGTVFIADVREQPEASEESRAEGEAGRLRMAGRLGLARGYLQDRGDGGETPGSVTEHSGFKKSSWSSLG